MHRFLLKNGYDCCENTVAKLMHCHGIKARTCRRFKVLTTDSQHDFPIAPNRLDQNFVASKPNQVWLTDFTYIKTNEGFTYLCTILDLYSRKIVGWATSRKIDSELAMSALMQAIILRSSLKGLVLHSDRGSQYASLAFQECLSKYGLVQSMSRKGNCYDNAPQESFYKSYKVEEVYRQEYETHEQATRGVRDYIERFYNRERLHSSLGYLSPNAFEALRLWASEQTAMINGSSEVGGGGWSPTSGRSGSGANGDQPPEPDEPTLSEIILESDLQIHPFKCTNTQVK